MEKFLSPKLTHLYSPFEFEEMNKVVSTLLKWVKEGKKILVMGDNDIDGICSTVVLVKVFNWLNIPVRWVIPRWRDKIEEKEEMEGIDVIITVDRGLPPISFPLDKIIITDHHEYPQGRPAVFGFLNPKFNYPFPFLAGVGVAYKLGQAIGMRRLGINEKEWFSATYELLELVWMGTVADKVEVVGENRVFIKVGKKEETGKKMKLLTGAKLNPAYGVKFLLEGEGEKELTELAEWQEKEMKKGWEMCKKEISTQGEGVLMVYHSGIPVISLGVCASRLAEKYSTPVIVMGKREDGMVLGEARGVGDTDFISMFSEVKELFKNWGGHKLAAGFVIEEKNISELKRRLIKIETPRQIEKEDEIIIAPVEEIEGRVFETFKKLEPFGKGNPRPVFITKIENRGGKFFNNLTGEILWEIREGKVVVKKRNDTIG
jgi:single-stranded-DNA-specific exonuclease